MHTYFPGRGVEASKAKAEEKLIVESSITAAAVQAHIYIISRARHLSGLIGTRVVGKAVAVHQQKRRDALSVARFDFA
jgi:hypothetical protein